jgi:hypothetical protein
MGDFDGYARVAYNAADFRLAELLGRLSWRDGRWYLSGEYLWREPSVRSSSIFTMVDFDRYQIVRGEVRRTVWRDLSIFGNFLAELEDSDAPVRTGLGVATPRYSLAWVYQTGSAGENHGIKASFYMPVLTNLTVYGNANLYRYKVQLEHDGRSDAYASSLGFDWNVGSGFSARSEVQYLRNAVAEDDVRLFVRLTKYLSFRPNPPVTP